MVYTIPAYTDFLSFQKFMFDKMLKNNQNMIKAMQIMTNPPDVDVGTTPADIVYQINNIKLLHYKPITKPQEPVPILIIYALINRPYILDLQPDRSVVKFFLQNGFDVYLIDWGEPREKDHVWKVDDYVNRFINQIVDYILDEKSINQLSILGYCMGGTLSTMYTALHPEKVKNFMVMAAPIYFETDESLLHVWANPEYFDIDRVVDTLGNIPPDFLNGGYMFLDPIGNVIMKYSKFLENVNNDAFVRMFLRMEKWINDGIPLAGETFREFIKYGYQQNLLVKNQWKLNGNTVNLKNITMPVLNIIGNYDHLVPPSASKPLLEYIGSTDTKELILPTGHIGLSVSSKSHRELWPKAVEWLKPRSQFEDADDADTDSENVNDTEKTSTSSTSKRGGGRRSRRGRSRSRSKKKK
jgi:polyhydroxyalkanoate synthase